MSFPRPAERDPATREKRESRGNDLDCPVKPGNDKSEIVHHLNMRLTKIGVLSLGCPRNLVDSQSISGRWSAKGYEIVDIKDADVGFVNTCSFIEDARRESIDAILELARLKKEGRLKKIIVGGCLSQRYKEKLLPALKEVDAFVGRVELDDKNQGSYSLLPKHFAYLKIAEGCNHPCSFCVIPKIKGRLKSRKMASIIEEVRRLDREGKSEIDIIGQDISHYGLDIYKKPRLAVLAGKIARQLGNVRWLRLLYLYPDNIDDELLDLISGHSRICKYLDLPLQHINDRILKRMKRGMDKKKIRVLLDKARKKIPGVAIRTSLIVGFPGETDREFKELFKFVREQRFERLGVFKYSREEGTPAFGYQNQIPEKVKQARFDDLMRLQQEISLEFNQGFLGKETEVLIDEKESEGVYLGRMGIDAPDVDGSVYVRAAKSLKPGDFVKVKITDIYEYDLAGEL